MNEVGFLLIWRVGEKDHGCQYQRLPPSIPWKRLTDEQQAKLDQGVSKTYRKNSIGMALNISEP
jgi:hypothetical protein